MAKINCKEYVPIETKVIEGELWIKQPDTDDVYLGFCPKPSNRWQTFVYHVCHGIIMQYSILDVLLWSWKNKDSFE